MKRIICAALIFIMSFQTCYAADYSSQLTELKSLLERCENEGIDVPYETVGVTTFERFTDYIAEDAENGVDSEIMEYNEAAMQKIYADTKSSLEEYLAGTKTPFEVPKYNMMNTAIKENGITDGTHNVLSVGYGHFYDVRRDLEVLNDFGAMNIQAETGPKDIIAVPDWSYSVAGSAEYYFDVVQESDNNKALKLVFKSPEESGVYLVLKQTINVEPSKKYYFKYSCKGTEVTKNALRIKIGDNDSSYIESVSDSWTSKTVSFTTGANTRSITVDMYLDKPCTELYLDNISLKALNSSKELVMNGDFESLYSQKNVNEILSYLQRAKKSNVAVSFLLQPMYFWRIPGCEDMYASKTSTSYNVNDERAKAKIEQYLRTIVPIVANCDAVRDICLTNEPSFDSRKYPDFYNPKFREYLIEQYGNLSTINSKWRTSYASIDEVVMPSEFSKAAIFYDWLCFNEDCFADWHKWMADIVREYTDKPLHSKIMGHFKPDEYEDRRLLLTSVDAEKFGEFLDYAGNDASCTVSWIPDLATKMMWYDYLYSVVDKPIYNSEDHFISDGSTTYDDTQKRNVRYSLWQGAVHGLSMSTMWVWRRSYTDSTYIGSILHRPDCVAEAGYTSLDMMRNADDVIKLSSSKPEVALLYSKTSRVFDDDYLGRLYDYYQALLFSGKRVGFVSESSLEKLSNYKYLVIPQVSYSTQETVDAVANFVKGGGKVIYYQPSGLFVSSVCLNYDKFGNSLNASAITSSSNATKFTVKSTSDVQKKFRDYFDDRVEVVDVSTGKEVSDVEYTYDFRNGEFLINLLLHSFDGASNICVYVDGQKMTGMTNIITGEVTGENHRINGYEPLTLKKSYYGLTPGKPQGLTWTNGATIVWKSDANSRKYEIYYTPIDGSESLLKTVDTNFCKIAGLGTYRIVGVNDLGERGEGESIFIYSDPYEISFNECDIRENGASISVHVENTSDFIQDTLIKIICENGQIAKNRIVLQPHQTTNFSANLSKSVGSVRARVKSANDSGLAKEIMY